MSVGAERARLEEARSQVRALRSEVCHFEALVDEPPSAASAATVADKVTKVCATNLVASKAVHTQPKSARATSLTSNGPASHQQLVHSTRPGAPAPPPRQRSIGTGPADEDVIVASHVQQLVGEGWPGDAALAAVQAVDGSSLAKAREWLKSHQCGSGAKTARALRTQREADPPSVAGGSGLPRAPVVGAPSSSRPSPAAAFARNLDKATNIDTRPQRGTSNHLLAGAPSTAVVLCVPPAEVTCDTTEELKKSVPSDATVSIKVRNLQGQVQEITELFSPSDTLLSVLTAYLRQFPMMPKGSQAAFSSSMLQLVVPLERTSYVYEAMRRVTLSDAKLCPRATVVLQVTKK